MRRRVHDALDVVDDDVLDAMREAAFDDASVQRLRVAVVVDHRNAVAERQSAELLQLERNGVRAVKWERKH